MQLRWKLLIVLSLLAAGVYGELIRDVRTPRAALAQIHALGTDISIQMTDFHRVVEARKKKYGPDSETALETQPPRMITRVNGKIVEEDKTPHQIADVIGLIVVGPPERLESTFPFRIDPHKVPPAGQKGEPGARAVKSRFGKDFPGQYAKYLEFDDRDTTTDRCFTISPVDLGWIGKLLRFQSGTFCVVSWKGASPGSMLVGVALAQGDPWVRPFTRRICRELTSVALSRAAADDHGPPPDYAACVLVDRPDRSGAAEALQAHVYQVRRDGSLAYVN